jgi:hypothetical protein
MTSYPMPGEEAQIPEAKDTVGLWERSLIAWPDGRRDTTSLVAWLQGPSLFADLRQPADPPSLAGVAGLDDLNPCHFEWLARQEGFAGGFSRAGDAFEWQRMMDYQCTSDAADAGYLSFSDGILVERGRDTPYIEHWHRTSPRIVPYFGARLRNEDGVEGFLVRVGEIFMYARDRIAKLPHGGSLLDLVRGSSVQEARAMLDCEISLGRVRDGSWTIGRSSLPFRVKAELAPSFSIDGKKLTISEGRSSQRDWNVFDIEVDVQKAEFPRRGGDSVL